MAKARKAEQTAKGEQIPLIDVTPENSKEIIAVAKRYKAVQTRRIEALAEEIAEKQKLLDLVKNANLQRLEDGKIRFRVDGMTITVTPRDELIKVKEDGEETDNED